MMKKYYYPLIAMPLVLVVYFALFSINESYFAEPYKSPCIIPSSLGLSYNLRSIESGSTPGVYRITPENLFHPSQNIPVSGSGLNSTKPSVMFYYPEVTHGLVAMCNPLPGLQKLSDSPINTFKVFLDDKEISHSINNNVLLIEISNHTKLEIVGYYD